MSWIVLASTVMTAAAAVWSVVLMRRVRDWRMGLTTAGLGLLAFSQLVHLLGDPRWTVAGSARPARDLIDLAIGTLALVSMPLLARMIRSVLDAVERREAQLRQVVDLVPHMIFAKDWDSRFLLANRALADAYGKDIADLIGVRQGEFQLSDEELEHFLADDRAVMVSGEPKFIPEEPFTDQQGEVRILETTKIPFTTSGADKPAMLGVAVDITERKRATDSLQLTLRELDHRVKNTLALVQAMAEHAAETADSVDSFVVDFRARVAAMGRMHDALREKRWNGVDLRELVELAVAPYRGDGGDDVRIHGGAVFIPAPDVQSLGMALHELAGNAAKYGAASGTGGRIDVEWEVEQHDGVARLRLVWHESGGPPVSPPAKRGSGLQIIEDGLRYELDGDAKVSFERAGVRAEIVIPLHDAGLGEIGVVAL